MAEHSGIRALQRIVDTSRKFSFTCTRPPSRATQTAPPAPNTPTIFESLPEHKPLLPLLLSHNIPPKLAKACASRYDNYARQSRLAAETRFAPYLLNRRSYTASVYSFFLESYTQMLRRWAQSVLNAALKSLKRGSVDLWNLDVTYPKPLWFPLPSDHYPVFVQSKTEERCNLFSASTPPHAFPTTYPPPLRPTSELPTFQWPRTPTTPPCASSSSTTDLDSLCLQFTKSLVIDENPMQLPRSKTSIFSLPGARERGGNLNRSRTQLSKRKLSKTQYSRELPTHQPTSITSPLNAAKFRQLAVPPSPPSPTRAKLIPRKTSAPALVSASQLATAPPQPSDSARHTTSITPASLNTSIAGDSDTYSHPCPSVSLNPQFPLNSMLDRTTYIPQDSLPSGPTTPPTLLPDLFSEPIVVPSTPVPLSLGSSLMPVADPFLRFQPQYDHFSDPYLISPFDYSGSASGLATSGFFSKSAFDTPPGFGQLSCGILAPTTLDPFETRPFSIYAVS